jgi:acetyl-CoA acetyltransferase
MFNWCFMFMLLTTTLATQNIHLQLNDVVVVGGMENMSNTPYYLTKAKLLTTF